LFWSRTRTRGQATGGACRARQKLCGEVSSRSPDVVSAGASSWPSPRSLHAPLRSTQLDQPCSDPPFSLPSARHSAPSRSPAPRSSSAPSSVSRAVPPPHPARPGCSPVRPCSIADLVLCNSQALHARARVGLVRRQHRSRHRGHHRVRPEGPGRRCLRRVARQWHPGRCRRCAPALSSRLLTPTRLPADPLPSLSLAEEIGAVESVKAASDIFAPVSGQIKEVNPELEDQPDLLNKSAEADGASTRFLPLEFRPTSASRARRRRALHAPGASIATQQPMRLLEPER